MELENLNNFNPSVCISGKVMRLNRMTANIFRKYLQPFGITDSQLTVLFILTKMDGLNQKRLSEITILEKSSLNRNLQRLLDNQLLTDKGFPVMKITEKGKRLVNKIIPEWKKAMTEIEELFGNDGVAALNTLMAKI